ncbi:MAG: DUF2914 domain-containing protein [bacterium]
MLNHDDRTSAHWCVVVLTGIALGIGGCGPDRDKLAKDLQEKMRAEMQAKIRAEVEARLRAELPRLEARLRAQLAGKKLPATLKPDPGVSAKTATTDAAVNPAAAKLEPAKPEPARPEPAKLDPANAVEPRPDPKGLTVKRLVIAKRVQDRKAMDVGTEFTVADGRVYCYVDAANAKGPERMLTVAWIRNGKRSHAVRLRVGKGSVWRTWSFLRLRKTSVGGWQCALHNEDGQLIGRAAFTVK